MYKLIFASILGSLITLSHAQASSGKVAEYLCDDGIYDDGYQVQISDLSHERQFVTLFRKSKSTTQIAFSGTVTLSTSNGTVMIYSNGEPDNLLELQVPDSDQVLDKSVAVVYTNKMGTKRIPELGFMSCTLIAN